jgi:hypothetical protein
MNKHKIAYDYAQACKHQEEAEDLLDKALCALGSENRIMGVANPITKSYTALVAELLGPELSDWLSWWMYETNYGRDEMIFTIDGTPYNPTEMTLYSFLEIVDAP